MKNKKVIRAKPGRDYEWLDDGRRPRNFGSKGPGDGSSLPTNAQEFRKARDRARRGMGSEPRNCDNPSCGCPLDSYEQAWEARLTIAEGFLGDRRRDMTERTLVLRARTCSRKCAKRWLRDFERAKRARLKAFNDTISDWRRHLDFELYGWVTCVYEYEHGVRV